MSLTTRKGLLEAYGKCAQRVRQRYNELKAAPTLACFSQLPGPKLTFPDVEDLGSCTAIATKSTILLISLESAPTPLLENGNPDLEKITGIKIERVIKI